MEINDENFAIKLTDQCNDHEQWLSIMRFGLGTLLENQMLLMELIAREAVKECERGKVSSKVPADYAPLLMRELNLRFVVNA